MLPMAEQTTSVLTDDLRRRLVEAALVYGVLVTDSLAAGLGRLRALPHPRSALTHLAAPSPCMERGQAERSEAGGEVNPRITKDFPELAETQGTRGRTNTIFSLRLSGALLPQKREHPLHGLDGGRAKPVAVRALPC